jgi:hypothetical protein
MVSLIFLWVQVKTVRLDEFTKDLGIHEATGHHGTMGSCGVCRIMSDTSQICRLDFGDTHGPSRVRNTL